MAAPLRERLSVVLVEPRYAGNVGFAARAMMNFGVTRLALVNPCPMTNEGRDRAVHAQRVLDEARVFATHREAYREFDFVAAFSARVSASDRQHTRNPLSVEDAAPLLESVDGRVALVFGREDDGLLNPEVEDADVLLQIPTSPMYASMNLSHAVAVSLYELTRRTHAVHRLLPASHEEKTLLFRYFRALLKLLRYPDYRADHTLAAFRRVVGRAGLSRWEFHRLMGVISSSFKAQKAWPVRDLPELPADLPEGEPADER